jgi:L-fucose dehydrogenase
MDLDLKDRVIVITGGGSGIGEAITRACLEAAAQVVVVGRMSQAALVFKEEVAATQKRCLFIEAELANPDECSQAIETISQRFGRLDGLVNNAGANDGVGLATGSPDRFIESLRQNLLHYYSMAHYSLPLLKESRGSIVNISSKVALRGQGGTSAYAAAKGAQLALTREWAAELAPYGIRVNCVLPSEVWTPLYEQWLGVQDSPERLLELTKARIPLGHRMTLPLEIAAMVAFLLSPSQSGHTTAQQIVIDGGYTHLDRALT